jgi:hypothetical protein
LGAYPNFKPGSRDQNDNIPEFDDERLEFHIPEDIQVQYCTSPSLTGANVLFPKGEKLLIGLIK